MVPELRAFDEGQVGAERRAMTRRVFIRRDSTPVTSRAERAESRDRRGDHDPHAPRAPPSARWRESGRSGHSPSARALQAFPKRSPSCAASTKAELGLNAEL